MTPPEIKAEVLLALGKATNTVPGDCDSVMILRKGVVSEIRPILAEERAQPKPDPLEAMYRAPSARGRLP